ncbi:MAG: RlmE family RNA methyltransferase [Methanomicrobiales archaeon]|nr:RlmE family RNA methyltransferase [Methanomicrobiales archaeon]
MSNPRWAGDRLHRRAAQEGYRSRAAFKLREIQERHRVVREGDAVLDLGAAPGSWLQVLTSLTRGPVVGVDLQPIAPVPGATLLVGDFSQPAVQARIREILPCVSVVLSDAAPKLSGNRDMDQARAVSLGEEALRLASTVLGRGGTFVVKSFQGDLFEEFLAEVKRSFRSVRVYRPSSTRKGSRECYIVARHFLAGRDPC